MPQGVIPGSISHTQEGPGRPFITSDIDLTQRATVISANQKSACVGRSQLVYEKYVLGFVVKHIDNMKLTEEADRGS